MGRSKSLLLAPIRFIGSILAFGVSFAGARLYNLDDYGNYQLTASSVAFFNVFLCFGLNIIILRQADKSLKFLTKIICHSLLRAIGITVVTSILIHITGFKIIMQL